MAVFDNTESLVIARRRERLELPNLHPSIHSVDVARPSQSLASNQLHYDEENSK